jgi:hypothetical protein
MRAIIIIMGVAVNAAFIGCNKNKGEANNVSINFTEPSIGDTIPSWNQLHVEGTISADGELKGYAVSVFRTSDNAMLFTTTYEVPASAYNFHEHWMNDVQDTTNVIVKLEVFKKQGGNKIEATREVVCLP